MKHYDFIVVGQGLAGSILAHELIAKNKKIVVINSYTKTSASSVAGGMFNPVTGKYLKKTWLDEQLFPYLKQFYQAIEQKYQQKILYNIDIFRPFSNLENKTHFEGLIEKNQLEAHVSIAENVEKFSQQIEVPFGGMYVKNAGWLDVPLFLEIIKDEIQNESTYLNETFDFDKLEADLDEIRYADIKADKIIFCEGYYVKDNPYFNWLPFNPVKGETLVANIENYDLTEIINQGFWLMPTKDNKVRMGSTYNWDDLDFENTEEARTQILEGVAKFLKRKPEIQMQQAGVRPSTQDRRPMIGEHPENKNVLIFNGLGTKGVSLAPYFIQQFVEFLLNKKDICTEVNIDRFLSLYKAGLN